MNADFGPEAGDTRKHPSPPHPSLAVVFDCLPLQVGMIPAFIRSNLPSISRLWEVPLLLASCEGHVRTFLLGILLWGWIHLCFSSPWGNAWDMICPGEATGDSSQTSTFHNRPHHHSSQTRYIFLMPPLNPTLDFSTPEAPGLPSLFHFFSPEKKAFFIKPDTAPTSLSSICSFILETFLYL